MLLVVSWLLHINTFLCTKNVPSASDLGAKKKNLLYKYVQGMQPTLRINNYTLGLGAFNKVHRVPHLESGDAFADV